MQQIELVVAAAAAMALLVEKAIAGLGSNSRSGSAVHMAENMHQQGLAEDEEEEEEEE